MEATDRARFIALVIALESLAVQRELTDVVPCLAALIDGLTTQLEKSECLAVAEHESLRTSLSSRLKGLRRESVRQAILRTLREHITDKDTIKFVDNAYGIRSIILHEGFREPKLNEITQRLGEVMRQIYSSLLGLPVDAGRPIIPLNP